MLFGLGLLFFGLLVIGEALLMLLPWILVGAIIVVGLLALCNYIMERIDD